MPRPSRAKLEKAEAALAKLLAVHAKELAAIGEQIDELWDRRAASADRYSKAFAKLQLAQDRASAAYEGLLERWRSEG